MIEEDWERAADLEQIYLREKEEEVELDYWEWYRKQKGTIIIEDEEGERHRVPVTLYDTRLPF
jgi:hypothetical protein